jgi:thiol-disulfide isomerase/thioredoxin
VLHKKLEAKRSRGIFFWQCPAGGEFGAGGVKRFRGAGVEWPVDARGFENYFARAIARQIKSMKKISLCLWSLAVVLLFAHATFAAKLGDAAAPLQIAEWVKGKPVDLAAFKGKQIVVVEFWATWCGPCRTSIPHLTAMQKKFKDVIFIGVSAEEADVVKKFVAKMGDQMDYVVATDKDGATDKGYMGAFDIHGIPHAFVVDKAGRVVWQGHPMAGLEEALTQISKGTYDMAKEQKRGDAVAQVQAFFELASTSSDEAAIKKAGAALEKLDREIGGIEPGEKFSADKVIKSVQFRQVMQKYRKAVAAKNETELPALEKQLTELAPAGFQLAEFKESLQFSATFDGYFAAVTGQGATNDLPALKQAMLAMKTTDARMANQIAAWLLTDESVKVRDLEVATHFAKAAVDLTDGKKANVLDTYAAALAASGKFADAVATQRQAIAAETDAAQRAELEVTLKKYEAKASAK